MADDQHVAVWVHFQEVLCQVDRNHTSTAAQQAPMTADTPGMQGFLSVVGVLRYAAMHVTPCPVTFTDCRTAQHIHDTPP